MRLKVLPVLFAGAFAATPAHAEPASVSLNFSANVETFCRIDTTERVVDQTGSIGSIRNTCNLAGGYAVRASFSNITSGMVRAGADTAAIDATGTASFVSHGPSRQTRLWSLLDHRRRNQNAPVIVRFSISPI